MKRLCLLVPLLAVLVVATFLFGGDGGPEGRYRRPATEETLRRWLRDHERKRALVPAPPEPRPAPPPAPAEPVDFSGTYRFGRYDYDLAIRQVGDRVTFRSGGVDRQDIGGAFETVGAGEVRDGRIRARWWCFDLSRNYANNGGAEMWFVDGDRDRLRVRYYHDADETIEEGYGVRVGTHEGEALHYRIRVAQPARTLEEPRTIAGTVRGARGEVLADAVVMFRHEESSATRTDARGRFALETDRVPAVLMVSAAMPGYRTQVEALLFQEERPLHFVLDPSPFEDDPRYVFRDPTRDRGAEIWNCGNCHRNSYEEWRTSRHAVAARNPVTRAVYERDFLPALERGEATVGDPGLCASCHAPQAALDGRVARLDEVEGVAAQGNHCDFCHKVHHVETPDAPGVRGSLRLGRPSPDDESVPGPIKRVYGVLADSDYLFMGPVYNPFFATSVLCAGCHQYETPNGIPALSTYDEWRAWAGARRSHESCQTCHMPSGVSMEGSELARRICVNALRRPTEQIHDHSFQGRDLAPTAVQLGADARVENGRLVVTVRVVARSVGHKVPTGTGDKHLLLVLDARDGDGRPLAQVAGPRVPRHASAAPDAAATAEARLEAHDFAGLPGRAFEQVLASADGTTHVPFWRAVRVVEDTRLVPDRPVETTYEFALPDDGRYEVDAKLWHRLRFKAHDPARGVEGEGVRPLDKLLATAGARSGDG